MSDFTDNTDSGADFSEGAGTAVSAVDDVINEDINLSGDNTYTNENYYTDGYYYGGVHPMYSSDDSGVVVNFSDDKG